MFKIVETLEKGKKQLTIVPSSWENRGCLYWPKTKAEKLIEDISSRPEDNWLILQCKLKRNYLISKEIAEEELERMLDKDETETEDEPMKPKRRVLKAMPKINITPDFNSLAESACIIDPRSQPKIIAEAQTDESAENGSESALPVYVSIAPGETVEIPTNYEETFNLDQDSINLSSLFNTEPLSDFKIKLDEIYNNQCELKGSMETVKTNQETLLNRVAKLEVMFEKFIQAFSTKQTTSEPEKSTLLVEPSEPINSVEELKKLEDELKEKTTFDAYLNKMSCICGKNSKGKSIDNCYILIDRFLTRSFVTQCSWAGGSRQANVEKVPFKTYKNVINLFFQLVFLSDERFTLTECHSFFKNVIKNSTRRSETSKSSSRQSRTKKRIKKSDCDAEKSTVASAVAEDVEENEQYQEANEDEP